MKIYTALDIVNASFIKMTLMKWPCISCFLNTKPCQVFPRCHKKYRIYHRAERHEMKKLRNDTQRRYDHNNPKIIEIDATSRFVIDNEYFLLMTVFSIGGGIQWPYFLEKKYSDQHRAKKILSYFVSRTVSS